MENPSKNLFLKFFTLKSVLAFCIFITFQSFHISVDATVSNPSMQNRFYPDYDSDSDYTPAGQQAVKDKINGLSPSNAEDEVNLDPRGESEREYYQARTKETEAAQEALAQRSTLIDEVPLSASIVQTQTDKEGTCYFISPGKKMSNLQKCLNDVKKNHFTEVEGKKVLTKCHDQQVAAYSCCNNPSKCSAEYKDGKHNAFGLNRDSFNMLLDAYPVIATAPFAFGKSISNNEQCKLANQLNTLGTSKQNLNALAEITEKSCLEKSYACVDDCNQAIEDMHKAVAECLLPDTPENEINNTKSMDCLARPADPNDGWKQCYVCRQGNKCQLCSENSSDCNINEDGYIYNESKIDDNFVDKKTCKYILVVRGGKWTKKCVIDGQPTSDEQKNKVTPAIEKFKSSIGYLFKNPIDPNLRYDADDTPASALRDLSTCVKLQIAINKKGTDSPGIYHMPKKSAMIYTEIKELNEFIEEYYDALYETPQEESERDTITLENMAGMDCKKYEDRSTRGTPQQQLRQFQMTMCPGEYSPLGNRPDLPNVATGIAAAAGAGSLASGAEINKEISTPDLNSLSIPPDNSVASAEHPGGSYNPGFSDGGSSMAGGDSGLGGFGSPLGGGSSPGYDGYPYSPSPSLSDGGYYSAAAGSNLGVFDDNSGVGYAGSSANNDRSPSSTTNTPSIGKYLPDGASSGTTIFRKASFIIQKYCEDKVIDGCYQK